jgi:hypothetical protein
MVPIVSRLMPISKHCQNSYRIYRQIPSGDPFRYPACRLLCRHLAHLVRPNHFIFTSQLTFPLEYTARLRSINLPLRLLVENEIFRLTVWSNPINDARRGTDHIGTTERTMTEVGITPTWLNQISHFISGVMDECNPHFVANQPCHRRVHG